MSHSVQFIRHNGEVTHAVVPIDEYRALVGAETSDSKAASVTSSGEQKATIKVSLLEARTKLGLSAAELAREAGVSPSYYALIESGERQASEANQRAIARALNLQITELRFN